MEKSLETLDAVKSAVVAGRKWMLEYYPPTENRFEEQSVTELMQHLDKAITVVNNMANTLLTEIEIPKEKEVPFVEEK